MRPDANLAGILDDLDAVLARYVSFPTEAHRHAVTSWVAHSWVVEAFDSTPRLALLSPEKGSGKTRCLEVIELHVPNPMRTVNVSAAAMFRKVAQGDVTLLLDEADTYLGLTTAREHEDLRGLVNAGHRRGAMVMRGEVRGKHVDVVEYPCFAPVALAGLGDLPDTIIDRSVIVPMRRRAPGEHVEPFRARRAERDAVHLAGRLEEWAGRAVERLEDREPEMPPGITDRPADVWEPLVIVGDAAGEPWATRVRQACVTLNAERAERDPSLGVQLLADVRTVFGDADRMTSEALVEALVALDSAPWADLRGKELDARGLARRLKKYGIRPADHRFGDGTKKGYLRTDLHDAWQRYLPPVAHVAHVAHPGTGTGHQERSGVALAEANVWGEGLSISHTETQREIPSLFAGTPEEGQQGQQGQRTGTCVGCDGPVEPPHSICDTCAEDIAL